MSTSFLFKTVPGLVALIMILPGTSANASLIVNGSFDMDLHGWETDTTLVFQGSPSIGVAWSETYQLAEIGTPGAFGVTTFSQQFDLPAGSFDLALGFDFLWQPIPRAEVDRFTVTLAYENTGGTMTEIEALLQTSADPDAVFGGMVLTPFSTVLSLTDVMGGSGNATLIFELEENNQALGTLIQLDNVVAHVVPEPATLFTWSGLATAGLLIRCRRNRR